MIALVIIAATAIVVLVALSRAIRIVPQARAYVIERLGSYHRTLYGGFNTLVPGVERVRSKVDLREQVVSFAPQPVITEDNLVVHIDTVLYFQVTDPRAATYEIANYLLAIEQLTVTTLRLTIAPCERESRSRAGCSSRSSAPARWQASPSNAERRSARRGSSPPRSARI